MAQITKSGYIFVLDRDTGKPLFEVEERRVRESDLRGEKTWPTQPFPIKPPPFARQHFNEEDITDISLKAQKYVKKIWEITRTGEQFIPPSVEGTMYFPGFDGGGGWGGASFDYKTGFLYVNSSEIPWIQHMVDLEGEIRDGSGSSRIGGVGERIYRSNCAICHGQKRKGNSADTYPALLHLKDRLSRAEALKIIHRGKGFMPSFGQFSVERENELLAYLMEEDLMDGSQGRFNGSGQELRECEIPYSHTGYNRFVDEEGYPAIKPP